MNTDDEQGAVVSIWVLFAGLHLTAGLICGVSFINEITLPWSLFETIIVWIVLSEVAFILCSMINHASDNPLPWITIKYIAFMGSPILVMLIAGLTWAIAHFFTKIIPDSISGVRSAFQSINPLWLIIPAIITTLLVLNYLISKLIEKSFGGSK